MEYHNICRLNYALKFWSYSKMFNLQQGDAVFVNLSPKPNPADLGDLVDGRSYPILSR